MKETTLCELLSLAFSRHLRKVRNWMLERLERHYLMCADTEQQHVREAQLNVAYYQKRAALARSARCQ